MRILSVLVCVLLSGCGGSPSSSPPQQKATVEIFPEFPPFPELKGITKREPLDYDMAGTWELLAFGGNLTGGRTMTWVLETAIPCSAWEDAHGLGRFMLIQRGRDKPEGIIWHGPKGTKYFAVWGLGFGNMHLMESNGQMWSAVRTEGGEVTEKK